MNSKLQYIALVAVIICLAGLLLVKQSRQDRFKPPRLPEIDRQAITRIKLTAPKQGIELVRQDDSWKILPGKYRADDKAVEKLLDALAGMQLTALVSESGNYTRYQLDRQARIKVDVFAGKHLVRSVDIGKTAPTGHHTFVSLEGDNQVFHARGVLRALCQPDTDHFRDKAILAFATDRVTALDIRIDNRKMEIKSTRDAASKARAWHNQKGDPIQSSRIEHMLNLLAKTRCRNFASSFPEKQIKLAIKIKLGPGSSQELALAAAAKNTSPYPGRSSIQATPFVIAPRQGRALIEAAENLFPQKR